MVKSSIDVDYHVMTHGKRELEVCCHFIWEMILGGIINNSSVCSNDHPVDIFTKFLQYFRIACICNRLEADGICAPPDGALMSWPSCKHDKYAPTSWRGNVNCVLLSLFFLLFFHYILLFLDAVIFLGRFTVMISFTPKFTGNAFLCTTCIVK